MRNLLLLLLIAVGASCQQSTKELESGVSFTYLEKGSGDLVDSLDFVQTNIHLIIEGDTVWSTYKDRVFGFYYLGRPPMITGFNEVLGHMKEGDRVLATIPPELGYGPSGNGPRIPPNSTLLFDIKIEKITRNTREE